MIEIEAVSIAAPVFRLAHTVPVTGITYNVFDHAVNLRSGGQLITLIDIRGGNLPYGICCNFRTLNLKKIIQPGSNFVMFADRIYFAQEDLTIWLDSANLWCPPPPGLLGRCLSKNAVARLVLWLRSLKASPSDKQHALWLASGLDSFPSAIVPKGDNWVSRFADKVNQLVCAVLSAEWNEAEKAAFGLMGLGIGLTPSGDDFLAGFLTAGLALGPYQPFQRLTKVIAQNAPERTTLVSTALLQALSQDQLSERFGALLAALNDGRNNLEEMAQRMLDFGSSSGLETMYGLIYGLRAVEINRFF